jgi:type I restriction enzyme R subunit
MTNPEDKARETIDRLLLLAGWTVCNQSDANIMASPGVAIRNFTLRSGHGFADYLLYVNGKAAGIIEAKKEGVTLTGVETQSEKYTKGLPDKLPAWRKPLPASRPASPTAWIPIRVPVPSSRFTGPKCSWPGSIT